MHSNNKKTKYNKQEKVSAFIKTISIIGLILFIVFVGAKSFGIGTFSQLGTQLSSFLHNSGTGNYPYPINFESVVAVKPYKTGVVLLTDTNTIFLDSKGIATKIEQHTFKSPSMYVNNNRAIVFDRESKTFRIERDSGILYEGAMEADVITASVGKSGNYAVASKSKDAMSSLTVFNRRGEAIFKWKCANEHIVGVALSDNGKKAAVVVLGATNAELFSRVVIFDFRYEEPLASYDYNGTALYNIEFNGRDTVIVSGDNIVSVIDNKERTDVYEFSSFELRKYAVAENGTSALLLAQFGNDNDNELTIWNKKGEIINTLEFNEKVRWLSCDDKYICVLFEDRLESYNIKGEKVGVANTGNDTVKAVVNRNNVYVLSVNGISKYQTIGEQEFTDALIIEDSGVVDLIE